MSVVRMCRDCACTAKISESSKSSGLSTKEECPLCKTEGYISQYEIDTYRTDVPVCPHCGHKDEEWWDGRSGDIEDGWEATCGACEREYSVSVRTIIYFSTDKS